MGTDIHVRLYDADHHQVAAPLREADSDWPRRRWFDDRDYTLFGFLANVRNGTGFAGCVTGVPLVPIAQPRGLPAWLSPADVDGDYDRADETGLDIPLGEHSFTWFTVAELLSADWEQRVIRDGVLSLDAYEQLLGGTRPTSWSGGISGPGIQNVDQETARMLLAARRVPGVNLNLERFYTRAQWPAGTLREVCSEFLQAVKEMEAHGDPDGLTVVVGFDS